MALSDALESLLGLVQLVELVHADAAIKPKKAACMHAWSASLADALQGLLELVKPVHADAAVKPDRVCIGHRAYMHG